METQPFTIRWPETDKNLPLLVDFPHSGTNYPDDFCFSCDKQSLILCEEKYLDELFISPVTAIGGTILKANFPRTYVDVNRADNDIDNVLLESPWPHPIAPNGRSIHGHGVVMRLMNSDTPIYTAPLPHSVIHHRLEHYYRPYHTALNAILEERHTAFGRVYHLSLHSMPSSVVNSHFPYAPPDIILGDLDGRSCGIEFRNDIADAFRSQGYRVAVNQLYKGAEIVRRYGNPSWGYHSLQIEINRACFHDERTGQKNKNFAQVQRDIDFIIRTSCKRLFLAD